MPKQWLILVEGKRSHLAKGPIAAFNNLWYFMDALRHTKTEMQTPLDELFPGTKIAFCKTLKQEATKAGRRMAEICIEPSNWRKPSEIPVVDQ